MRVLTLVLQVALSLVLTASIMPAVLFAVPAAREDRLGLPIAGGVLALVFVLLVLVWPRRKR